MTRYRHKTVPSKVKQLAERRARIAGRLLPLDKIESDLRRKVEQLALELRVAELNLESCTAQKRILTLELQECDKALVGLSPNIDPHKIEAIQGSKGRYGVRGGLKNAVLDVLRDAYPIYLTTTQIEDVIALKFKLVFVSDASKCQWKEKSLAGALRSIADDGKGERGPKIPGGKGSLNTTWRLKVDKPLRLSDL